MVRLCIKEDIELDVTKLFIITDDGNILIEYLINDAVKSFEKSLLLKDLIIDGIGYFYVSNNDIITINKNSIEIEMMTMYFRYEITLEEHEQFLQEIIGVLSKYVF